MSYKIILLGLNLFLIFLIGCSKAPLNLPQGKILFSIEKKEGNGIPPGVYIMNLDGRGMKRIIEGKIGSGEECYPSADGKEILLRRGEELWAMNLDGSGKRRLSQEERHSRTVDPESLEGKRLLGVLSPDGKKVVSRFKEEGERGFLINNIDGSEKVKVVDDPNDPYSYIDFFFSPDSKMIAFEAYRSYHVPEMPAEYHYYNIGIMSADGTGKRILTDNKHPFSRPLPRFTPNSKKIIYYSQDELHLINLEDAKDKKLAKDVSDYSFTIDGRIIFVREKYFPFWFLPLLKKSGIYVMNIDGTDKRKLANLPKGAHSFSFFWPKQREKGKQEEVQGR